MLSRIHLTLIIFTGNQLGPSALAGFSLFILIVPFQERLMTLQHRMRLASMKWTDQRAKVLLEVLGTSPWCMGCAAMLKGRTAAMRVVKYFSYEVPFLQSE